MKSLKIYTFFLLAFLFATASLNAQTARVQIIHNSADAAASVVDVWLNNTKLLSNFAFRTATPYITAPAGVLLNIGIAPPNSTSWTQSFRIKQVSLTENQTYVIVAGGIISTSGYNPSPTFLVSVYPIGREVASQAANTDVLVAHGATDAPTVDIYETGVGAGQIVNNLMYGNVAGYLELPTANYVLEVRDETGTVTVAAYSAPLATLGLQGQAITVLASGFLNPSANSNGAPFGLYVALASGGALVELPVYNPTPTARVQVIHNAADAAAASVDVWLNDTKLLADFAFRTATPFIDAPAGVEFTIAIQPPGSTSPANPIWSQNYTLAAGKTYILVAEGIVSPSGYNPSIPFDIAVYDMGREEGIYEYFVDVLIHHGATDAPTVDIYDTWQTNPIQLVNNISYSEFADYLSIINGYYLLEVRDESGTNTLATFEASLGSFLSSGDAATIIASGFLNPANNSNGPAFGLWVALAEGGDLIELPSIGNTSIARVQVIHNAADAAAEVVDVWLNDTKLIADFAFRTATPFIDAPAGVEFTIAIKPPGSTSPANPIWSQNYTLMDGGSYILVANGLVDNQNYLPFKPFDIYVLPTALESATAGNETAISVFHGSTDAPTVDIVEVGVGAGTIVDDLSYGNFVDYLNVITADYVVEVRDATGTVTVASYAVPLATFGLHGQAVTVLASGFLNPSANNNGAPFGLYVALASGGDLIDLPVYSYTPTARVQVIHNAADAAAASVDVWLNDTKIVADFAFRTATPFIDAPAGVEFTIAIQPPGSTSPANPIWSQNYTLADGGSYILVANGLVDNQNYTPFKPFDIYVLPTALEAAANSNETAVAVFHGSTDAPTVDVVETGVGAGTIIDNFEYGNFAGYLNLPTANYVLEVRDETGTVSVASYSAPLATLGLQGQALTVLASGFLNPSANNNGAPFGLYVALSSGGALVELPVYTPSARVQVIHNAADAAAASVDVWLNDTKLLADFAFRTATPFIDAPAGVEFTIAIQPPGSTSPANPIWSQNYTLADGETYVLIANGLVDNQNYTPFKPFDIYVYAMGREASASSNLTDVLVFHGSTDAPTVDVVEIGVGAGTIIDNFEYGNFAGYLSLTTTDYLLAIRDETGTTTVAAFAAPLGTLGLGGQALTVVASGFLNPVENNNGEPFGLYAALASGGALVQLPVVTSVEEQNQIGAFNLYPNPATSKVNILLDILSDSEVTVSIYNMIGSMVKNENFGRLSNGMQNKSIDVTDLSEGIYLMKVTANKSQKTQKVLINK